MAASPEIGPVGGVRLDWANLRTGHAEGLVARSRGLPRKRNASRIGTVLTATKIFV